MLRKRLNTNVLRQNELKGQGKGKGKGKGKGMVRKEGHRAWDRRTRAKEGQIELKVYTRAFN